MHCERRLPCLLLSNIQDDIITGFKSDPCIVVYLKVHIVGKDGIRIAGISDKQHVCKLELCFRYVVIGGNSKISECLIEVGLSRKLAVVIDKA